MIKNERTQQFQFTNRKLKNKGVFGYTLDGRTKEEEAIDFIREHEPPEGYFLGFSGGKDSTVLIDITKKSGVKFEAYYASTGIDPPELVKYIREYHPDVIFRRPEKSFFAKMQTAGYPTKVSRWCCDYLKKQPMITVPLKHRLMGIRAEESARRKKRGRFYNYDNKYVMYSPLFWWLEWEIWNHIEKYKLPYCSLYDEGHDRLGCVVCPYICHKDSPQIQRSKERWPNIYRAFEKAMQRLYNKREREGKYNYGLSFNELLRNWYNGFSQFTSHDHNDKTADASIESKLLNKNEFWGVALGEKENDN